MPLTTPPSVRIGINPTWYETRFDTTTRPEDVQHGAQHLPAEGVEFIRWTVYLDDEPAQVVELKVCGPSVPFDQRGGAVLVPSGTHDTELLIVRGTGERQERILRPGDRPLTVAGLGSFEALPFRTAVFTIDPATGAPVYDPANGTAVVLIENGSPVLYLPGA